METRKCRELGVGALGSAAEDGQFGLEHGGERARRVAEEGGWETAGWVLEDAEVLELRVRPAAGGGGEDVGGGRRVWEVGLEGRWGGWVAGHGGFVFRRWCGVKCCWGKEGRRWFCRIATQKPATSGRIKCDTAGSI